jgi:FAD/FMN-containing dehydrogenase
MLFSLLALLPLALAQGLQPNNETAGIQLVLPSDGDYQSAAASFNRRFNYQPAGIAYPNSAGDVAKLVQFGVQNKVNVAARSGGHSYIALGVGGENGALISTFLPSSRAFLNAGLKVDLQNLKQITYDSSTNQATVQAGNHLGDLALALNSYGRALPHGSCVRLFSERTLTLDLMSRLSHS